MSRLMPIVLVVLLGFEAKVRATRQKTMPPN